MSEELSNYAGCDALLNINTETKMGLLKHIISVSTMARENDWARMWNELITSFNRKLSAVHKEIVNY